MSPAEVAGSEYRQLGWGVFRESSIGANYLIVLDAQLLPNKPNHVAAAGTGLARLTAIVATSGFAARHSAVKQQQ